MVVKFSSLMSSSSREKAMIVRSLLWLSYYRAGLWLFPSIVTRRAANDLTDAPDNYGQTDNTLVDEVLRSVRRCSRYIPAASCLTQALAAKTILKHYGQPSKIRIGVAPTDSTIEAHAWVEIDNKIVLGRLRQHARFAVMTSRPDIHS
ncbi:MAG: lasso peptide biosynthesis B2 protein [Pyrinomonadaceae bacterium]